MLWVRVLSIVYLHLRPSCWAHFQLFWLKRYCFPFELNIFISLQPNYEYLKYSFLCVLGVGAVYRGLWKRSLREKKIQITDMNFSNRHFAKPGASFLWGGHSWRIVSVLHLSRSNLLLFIFNCTFTFRFSCTIFGRKLAALSCQPCREIFKPFKFIF